MALTLQQLAKAEIASPPGIYFQLREVIDDPDGTFEDIGRVISNDPALAARLLKIVNSAFYGMSAKVETIPHALMIIGSDQLSELALATSVVSKFKGIPKELFDLKGFWIHSLGCGIAARLIAAHKSHEHPEKLYLAGMLHDIGKLVLLKENPEVYQNVLVKANQSEDKSLLQVEKEALHYTHAQVGGILLKEWRLPPGLSNAVNYHHEPLKAKTHGREASIVHVADFLMYEMELGRSGEPSIPTLQPEALKLLDLTPDFIKETKTQVEEQTLEAADLFF